MAPPASELTTRAMNASVELRQAIARSLISKVLRRSLVEGYRDGGE
jgi:hypothetical protein